jgi:hypothetical protein
LLKKIIKNKNKKKSSQTALWCNRVSAAEGGQMIAPGGVIDRRYKKGTCKAERELEKKLKFTS